MSKDGSRSDKRGPETRVALITTGGTIVVALIGAAALYLTHGGDGGGGGKGPTSSPSSLAASASVSSSGPVGESPPESPPPGAQVTGAITDPPGAGNVQSPKTITASGTVQHLQQGHHLLVFLQFGSQNKYWAGDPDVKVSDSGHWSGTVCVGDPGDITLLLVDVGPKGLAALKRDKYNLWSNGVPFVPTKLASDVDILNRVSVTAVPAGTACTNKEPAYY